MEPDLRQFSIDRCLGSGGFGEVYLATMRSPGGVESEVALKVLHRGLDPRSQPIQRLRDEARLLGTLNHPAVLKVHDLVLLDGRIALVTEYVDGADLDECIRAGLPLRATLEVIARTADALHAAYTSTGPEGVPLHLVHRDIKPSNIRVGRHADVRLLDFGIAKAADARREARTQTHAVLGSPWYMAPERFDDIHDDPASDVYALGVTLHEALSGARLFEDLSPREHFRLAMQAADHDARIRSALAGLECPPDVRELLASLLAFDPRARPTAADLAVTLDDRVEDLPGQTLRRWCRDAHWPTTPAGEGELQGRQITEQRLSGAMYTPAPTSRENAPASRESAPTATFDDDSRTLDLDLAEVTEVAAVPEVAEVVREGELDVVPVDASVPPAPRATRTRGIGRALPLTITLVVLGVLTASGAVFAGLFLAVPFMGTVQRPPTPWKEGDTPTPWGPSDLAEQVLGPPDATDRALYEQLQAEGLSNSEKMRLIGELASERAGQDARPWIDAATAAADAFQASDHAHDAAIFVDFPGPAMLFGERAPGGHQVGPIGTGTWEVRIGPNLLALQPCGTVTVLQGETAYVVVDANGRCSRFQ